MSVEHMLSIKERQRGRVSLLVGFVVIGVLAGWQPSASAETIDRVAAVVDDEVITFNDLRIDGRIRLASTGVDIEMLDQAPNRRSQIEMLLDRMVQTKLLVAEADRMQIPVGSAEVEQRLKMIYERFGATEEEYKSLMAEAGIPWASFRRFLRDELTSQAVIRTELGGQAGVSKADVEACARERMPAGENMARVTLRQILVAAEPQQETLGKGSPIGSLYPALWNATDAARFAAAHNIYDMVTTEGQPFAEVASKYSAGKSRERAGALGTFEPGDLASEFDPVFQLEMGAISDIIETGAGFHIILVENREDVANQRWADTVQTCEGELMQSESAKLIEGWIDTLEQKHFVEVKLMDDISGAQ